MYCPGSKHYAAVDHTLYAGQQAVHTQMGLKMSDDPEDVRVASFQRCYHLTCTLSLADVCEPCVHVREDVPCGSVLLRDDQAALVTRDGPFSACAT